ncbi:MAG: hypothetical protein OM95_03225 [Bdellovibrio sp. ArHS]|uniref:hypothetical protein n=1 Tax=Bdellovibrio sp. ArHS TaxID=1569284 RepID=UPI000583A457|nr:hypothetical protein [Bdellovibrio sp. ArHS]KHD89397.1 MAG: hypothetical protein OM95_03225 [Bdellovibrio sp. ArHS]
MNKFMIALIFTLFGSVSFAADCISKSEMQTIASHFSQFRQLANKDYCFDGSQTANLLQTIMFMRKTGFEPNMQKSKDELFSGRFASSWYDYFIGRIDDINVQASCPKGVGAYVYGFGNTMYVCPMMLTESFSALDRASVFMHEARHIDGYPHTTCSKGARKGLSGACDTRISDGGSYAVTVETYAQLAKYATDIHPALKAYAIASAVTYADEAFEVPVKIDRQEKLLLMAESTQLYTLEPSANNKITAQGNAPFVGKIVPRAQHMILIPTDRTQTARYLFANNEGEIVQSAGDAIVEYNGQTPGQRAQLADLHLGAQWSAKVYSQSIQFACDPRSAATKDMKIPQGEAVSILYVNGYSRSILSVHLLTSNGKIYEIGCTSGAPFITLAMSPMATGIVRAYKINGQLIGLTEAGSLVSINGTQTTPLHTGLEGQIYEMAPRQSFSFMDAQ